MEAWAPLSTGFLDRQKKETQEPAAPDNSGYESDDANGGARSHGYYPDAGAGSVRDQIRRSQGAYGSVYGEGLNCGPGCEPEGNICSCNPADVGGPRTPAGNTLSPYEGGGVTVDDVVGEPGTDGNTVLPDGY